MKVWAVNDVIRQCVLVYVEVGREDHQRVFQTDDGAIHKVAYGEEPPMFMRVPHNIAEKIGEALAPRPEAGERHLDDAITVRDRLLTIIENDRSKCEYGAA